MIYYAVIDTNVVVSAFLKRNSIPDEIIQNCLNGTIVPLLNDEILFEYFEVLSRNKFGLNNDDINNFLVNFCNSGIFIDKETTIEEFLDEDDAVFYEIVMTARKDVDAYLITGNKKHFPVKTFVVTPREMIEIIKTNDN